MARLPSSWLLSTGVFALAWVAGFLDVVAPAGVGFRQAALVIEFAGVLAAADRAPISVGATQRGWARSSASMACSDLSSSSGTSPPAIVRSTTS